MNERAGTHSMKRAHQKNASRPSRITACQIPVGLSERAERVDGRTGGRVPQKEPDPAPIPLVPVSRPVGSVIATTRTMTSMASDCSERPIGSIATLGEARLHTGVQLTRSSQIGWAHGTVRLEYNMSPYRTR